MKDRQITVSPLVVELPRTTERDSNNVERTWRLWKAVHLVRTDWLLARLLGRPV